MKKHKLSFYQRFFKRIFDLVFSLILLVLFSPIFLLISATILVTSGIPIIYKQQRVGKHGKLFEIFKFRTMVINADVNSDNCTRINDSRITNIGKILRKTSLDELPQLFNIVKGEMSFIGFRPDVLRASFDENDVKYRVCPGITGYAQINGRSKLTQEEKHFWEKSYVSDISLKTDLKILFKTFKVVFHLKDSY